MKSGFCACAITFQMISTTCRSGGRIHNVSASSWRNSGLQGLSDRCDEEKQLMSIQGAEPHSLRHSAISTNKPNAASDKYPFKNNKLVRLISSILSRRLFHLSLCTGMDHKPLSYVTTTAVCSISSFLADKQQYPDSL